MLLRNVLLLAAAASAAATAAAAQAVPPAARDFCVVGAGPGGLQFATLLAERGNDFALFEKNDNGGSFYRKYPIHRTLISINKRATSRGHSPEFNERHDWNSLLSNNDSLKMTRYSRKFYPSADELVRYLEDYSQRLVHISPANSVHFSTEVMRVSRAEGSETALDLHTRPVSIEDDLNLDGGDVKISVTRCGRVIWATGTQPKGLDDLVEGADLDGVEHYSEVDPTSERYFNESVALIGAGNAGMEIATALQNSVGFIALMSDFQFSWRSHYVGDVRSVNAQFVDGYLLKSLDYINSGGRFNIVKRNHAHGKLQIDMKRPQSEAQIVSTAAGDRVETDGEQAKAQKEQPGQDEMMMNISAWDLEKNTDVCEVDMDGCKNRLHAESARGSILGFDRVIFCTGFRFKMADPPEPGDSEEEKKRKSLFDANVRPVLNRDGKYPQQSRTYQSRNVKGLFFAGALAHELDFKRSAGGFIHGFRYTARALHHILVHDLPRDRPGSRDWPSVPLTKKQFIGGELAQRRINEMAGPYQMFAELCDLIVFEADEKSCAAKVTRDQKRKKKSKKKKKSTNEDDKGAVFARYYKEVPVSYMPEFVSQKLGKSKYMSVCYDYGHGKFSEMDTLHHKYIGTRFGPIAEGLGMSHLFGPQAQQGDGGGDPLGGMGSGNVGTNRPSKRMGPTGAGVDSNFLHPVFSLYDLDDESTIVDVEEVANTMMDDRTHLMKRAQMMMQHHQQGMGQGMGGGGGGNPASFLKAAIKSYVVLYPIATHHLLEDLDTMWNLWYTHTLPMKWWLEDRASPCEDFYGDNAPDNGDGWSKRRDKYLRRVPHFLHVEIFCKSYEYERYLVRTNRGDDDGNWRRPSDLGHVHRVSQKYDHFDLQPDGGISNDSPDMHPSTSKKTKANKRLGVGEANKQLSEGVESSNGGECKAVCGNFCKGPADAAKPECHACAACQKKAAEANGKNEDTLRKEAVLREKQEQLRMREREELMDLRRHTEKLRKRARMSLDELDLMFVSSGAAKNGAVAENVEVDASGRSKGTTVRGIPLSEI